MSLTHPLTPQTTTTTMMIPVHTSVCNTHCARCLWHLPVLTSLALSHASAGFSKEEETLICHAHAQRLATAVYLLLDKPESNKPEHNRPSARFVWADHVARLTPAEFKLRYRVCADSFYKLLGILESALQVDEVRANYIRPGNAIAIETRLAAALRYFAGGDPLDLKLIYCMSKQQVMNCVWHVVDAIHLNLDNIQFPLDDHDKLQVLESEFASGTRGQFWRGQVGAIDGVHFKMKCPSSTDCKDPMRFYVSRKQEFALLAIAICDYHRRFTFVEIAHASQTHDSAAWSATELAQRICKEGLPCINGVQLFLNGDAAFPLSPTMITPSNGDPSLDNFDFYQSSNRMAIECAFGILVRRWGVLWRPLSQKFDRRAPLVAALMKLHNFCITERLQNADGGACEGPDVSGKMGEVQPSRFQKTPKFDKDQRPVHHLDTCRSSDEGAPSRALAAQRGPKASTRDALAAALAASGYVRMLGGQQVIRKAKRPRGRAAAASVSPETA